jgi:hypothetical protein
MQEAPDFLHEQSECAPDGRAGAQTQAIALRAHAALVEDGESR